VLLEDFVVDSARSAIKFGMQGLTPVENITVRDFHGTMSSKGLDISHDMGQEDYRNLSICRSSFDRTSYPLRISIRDNAENWGGKGRGVASVVGVELSDLDFMVPEDGSRFVIHGFDKDNIVRDVKIQNMRVNGRLLEDSDADPSGEGILSVGPFVSNITIQGRPVKLPPWPEIKSGKGTPPPSKSRAGKAWEERSRTNSSR
jgi:hypothetical protein